MENVRKELKKQLDANGKDRFKKLKIGYDYWFADTTTIMEVELTNYYRCLITRKDNLYQIELSHLDKVGGYIVEKTFHFDRLECGVANLVEYIDFKDII